MDNTFRQLQSQLHGKVKKIRQEKFNVKTHPAKSLQTSGNSDHNISQQIYIYIYIYIYRVLFSVTRLFAHGQFAQIGPPKVRSA